MKLRLEELNKLTQSANIWEDQKNAQTLMKEKTMLENKVSQFVNIESEFQDAFTLAVLGEEEKDNEVIVEAENLLRKIEEKVNKLELGTLLSGEADDNHCYIEINSGAGGTESQDWASMLLRMYMRWMERNNYEVEWLEESEGDEAGIKSVSIKVKGEKAYGWLKTESGVHRLVRISPFDSQSRRHTSFASVWVYPVIEDDIEIKLEDKDLRVDTYRASGAGGQHVNKTDSAIRITHLPTKIVVQCQNQRSQHQNRAEAFKMLRARLYELELQDIEQKKLDAESAKTEIGWGHQIRSYVLQPYQLIKDLRTQEETSNTQAVLDGDIDIFIQSALALRIGDKK